MLKLLDSMKGNLPQVDITKYKTSESHLNWENVAFNSYSAEMCKQKWQEVSKEVSLLAGTLSETLSMNMIYSISVRLLKRGCDM